MTYFIKKFGYKGTADMMEILSILLMMVLIVLSITQVRLIKKNNALLSELTNNEAVITIAE